MMLATATADRTRRQRIAARRAVTLVAGLALFAWGITAMYEARLGLSPWDVLHQGIARHTPLSFGAANIAVSAVALALAAALRAPIGIGTVANAVLVGSFVALFTGLPWVDALADARTLIRWGVLAGGVLAIGCGTAFYVSAGLGAGPRDALMLAGARRGISVGASRAVLEVTVLIAGVALGGQVGVATLVFAVAIGPVVSMAFRHLALHRWTQEEETS